MNDNASTDGLLAEAARAVRPYLSELVGGEATQIDTEIASLLESARTGTDVTEALSARLEWPAALRDWVAAFLDLGGPVDVVRPALRSYYPLPGARQESLARRFACPEGDYVWYSVGMARRPPECPTHNLRLVPVDAPG